jgi:hypothetical protein
MITLNETTNAFAVSIESRSKTSAKVGGGTAQQLRELGGHLLKEQLLLSCFGYGLEVIEVGQGCPRDHLHHLVRGDFDSDGTDMAFIVILPEREGDTLVTCGTQHITNAFRLVLSLPQGVDLHRHIDRMPGFGLPRHIEVAGTLRNRLDNSMGHDWSPI